MTNKKYFTSLIMIAYEIDMVILNTILYLDDTIDLNKPISIMNFFVKFSIINWNIKN